MGAKIDDLRGIKVHPHKVELFLSSASTRRVFKLLLNRRPGEESYIEKIARRYCGEKGLFGTLEQRLMYPLFYLLMEVARIGFFKVDREFIREQIFNQPLYLKVIPLVLESVAELGLTRPQNFVSPLLVVWNFTNACNLKCKHCYQDATRKLPNELSLEERLDVVDQLDEMKVPFLAFSGGEPLMDKEIWKVAEYAKQKGIWLALATNGTLITKKVAQQIKEVGIDYVEISLDSADPQRHDQFRGIPGYWERAVRGIKNCVELGLSVGLAATFSQFNFDELDDLYQLSVELNVDKFYLFNFIPTGRAKQIADWDPSPQQREQMLKRMHSFMLEEKLSVLTTAPQFSRACMQAAPEGPLPTSHYNLGIGLSAKYIARYVGGCGAGRVYCALQPDGKVTPCVFIGDLVVGDIRNQSFKEIWRNSEVLNVLRDRDNLKENCHSCQFRDFCGGCRARAWNYFRDITGPDPGCIYNNEFWKKAKVQEKKS